MINWRAAYLLIGAILCLAGAVVHSDELIILGSTFAVSAGLQFMIRAYAGSSEPELTRASRRRPQSVGRMPIPGAGGKP